MYNGIVAYDALFYSHAFGQRKQSDLMPYHENVQMDYNCVGFPMQHGFYIDELGKLNKVQQPGPTRT